MATRYIVGVGAAVRNDDGRFLLVRQMRGYWQDQWIFPGGKLEMGETLEECARREVLEETGCEFKTIRQIGAYVSYDPVTSYEKQVVLIYYLGEFASGCPIIGEGVTDTRWFALDEIKQMAAEGKVPELILKVAFDSVK